MEPKIPFREQKDIRIEVGAEIRHICDPRLETNARSDPRRRQFLYSPTIPSLIRGILYRGRRYHGVAILLCNSGAESSFKHIPLSIRMLYRSGVRVDDYLMVYLSMYSGRKGRHQIGESSRH